VRKINAETYYIIETYLKGGIDLKKSNSKLLIDEERRLLTAIASVDPSSDEYHKLITRLKEISEIKRANGETFGRYVVPVIIGGGITLVEMALVMNYERFDIITTKCWNWIYRPKL
jgi:hypothetical protein